MGQHASRNRLYGQRLVIERLAQQLVGKLARYGSILSRHPQMLEQPSNLDGGTQMHRVEQMAKPTTLAPTTAPGARS
jgi:hypothetical protein